MDIPGVGRMSVIADPTGATICLFQPGEHQGSPPSGPQPGTFGWSELATRDTDRAGRFYSELFDWGMKTDQGDPIPYTEFQLAGESIGGMLAMTEQYGDAPPHWLPYVMVEDCNETFGKATKLGAKTYVPPMDIPNVGRFAVFADPTGAALAIIQLTERG
jgi:predicted enzyme related to lactoylglutathione lyase